MERELPIICENHTFAASNLTITPTCGAFSGADVFQEVMVISSPPPKDYQPQKGDVCQKCFQICGEDRGIRDKFMVKIFQDLASWE